MTVNQAALTITAEDKTKVYGAALPGLTVKVDGLVNGDTTASTLELERFEVWAPGAKVWIQAAADAPPQERPPPATRYFRGRIAGAPNSRVLLSVRANGAVNGVVEVVKVSRNWTGERFRIEGRKTSRNLLEG